MARLTKFLVLLSLFAGVGLYTLSLANSRAEPPASSEPDDTIDTQDAPPRVRPDRPAQDEAGEIASAATPDIAPAIDQGPSSPPQAPSRGLTSASAIIGPGGTPAPGAPILDTASQRIAFQAILTDNNGDALPGPTVDLDFQFYDGGMVSVGAVISMLAVSIENGVVDVLIPVDPTDFDGSERLLGVTVDAGPELTPRIPIASVPHAFRVDRVENPELTDNVELGTPTDNGSLRIFKTAGGAPSVTIDGSTSEMRFFGFSNDNEGIRLTDRTFGEIQLFDDAGTDEVVRLSATGGSGGELSLRDASGLNSIFADGSSGFVDTAGELRVVDGIGGPEAFRAYQLPGGADHGGRIETYDQKGGGAGGVFTAIVGASTTGGGVVQLFQKTLSNTLGLEIDGDATGANGGGDMTIFSASQNATVFLDGDEGDGGALLTLSDGSQVTIDLDANGGGGGGAVILTNSEGVNTVVVDADSVNDSVITIDDGSGDAAIRLHSDNAFSGPQISMWARTTGNVLRETVEIIASEGTDGGNPPLTDNGAQIILRDSSGNDEIVLDAEFGDGGPSRIAADVFEVRGGSDLSENFDIRGDVKPGYLTCIDPQNPGKLVVSGKAYDRTVAGIVSGANGIHPGMLMGQLDSEANGEYPVALTGRVYVWADASVGAIEPGDLLTTAGEPGHAMKVTDYARAQGAIIGKAMTPLAQGKGLVLVLVSLQ